MGWNNSNNNSHSLRTPVCWTRYLYLNLPADDESETRELR